MLAKIINDVVEKYPYSIGELRKDNSNVSFPKNLDQETLAAFNAFNVVSVERPTSNYTQEVTEGTPQKIDGVWTQTWVVSDLSEEILAERMQERANEVRMERNQKLTATDWTQLIDSPFSNDTNGVWQTYRQALRDIPSQAGFPWDVVWPSEPN